MIEDRKVQTGCQDESKYTITGTRPYLSYELYTALVSYQREDNTSPYLCDVVSLALMVFNMMRLSETGVYNTPADAIQMQENVFQSHPQYSEKFKGVLKVMLAIKASERPDFLALLEFLKQNVPENIRDLPITETVALPE